MLQVVIHSSIHMNIVSSQNEVTSNSLKICTLDYIELVYNDAKGVIKMKYTTQSCIQNFFLGG